MKQYIETYRVRSQSYLLTKDGYRSLCQGEDPWDIKGCEEIDDSYIGKERISLEKAMEVYDDVTKVREIKYGYFVTIYTLELEELGDIGDGEYDTVSIDIVKTSSIPAEKILPNIRRDYTHGWFTNDYTAYYDGNHYCVWYDEIHDMTVIIGENDIDRASFYFGKPNEEETIKLIRGE